MISELYRLIPCTILRLGIQAQNEKLEDLSQPTHIGQRTVFLSLNQH
jgi:hypothetical protein